jgi:hypothetical protein
MPNEFSMMEVAGGALVLMGLAAVLFLAIYLPIARDRARRRAPAALKSLVPVKREGVTPGEGANPTPGERPENRVHDLVAALQKEGRVGALEEELKKLDPSTLSPEEEEPWWHMYGCAAFRAGREIEALERFEEGYKKFPQSAAIRFSLGQQHIRAGVVEKGFELFRSCKFPVVSREWALCQARYAYLWNRYQEGIDFLMPFFEAYKQVKILDDHFLYVRGLPFFGRWWGYLAAFSILSDDLNRLESITDYLAENCLDYDFDYLRLKLRACRDGATSALLEAMERKDGPPTAYVLMNIAAIRAQEASTLDAARQTLADVGLSAQDSWLDDVRTLALADAAHRFGDPALEQECITVFLKRQPLLLEPDDALNFQLLRYQEHLKPRVTADRQSADF